MAQSDDTTRGEDMTRREDARRMLKDEATRLRALIEREGEAVEELRDEEGVELDDVDAHRGDRAPQLAQRQQEGAMAGELAVRLEQVEEALHRVDQGTYGVCEVCGGQIDEERLEARPTAVRCRTHA